MPEISVRVLEADDLRASIPALAEVLFDCVAGGASVSFLADFTLDESVRQFTKWADEAAAGQRAVIAAFVDGRLDGTAQLLLGTPPNQPHRADLAKMLVHRRARRLGLGRRLFEAAEQEALRRGRTLLTFDTVTGGAAEGLYLSCGCVKVGEIPDYAMFPDGNWTATSVFYKRLSPSAVK